MPIAKNIFQPENEEELKAKVYSDFFGTVKFIYRPNIDRIDFVIMDLSGRHLLWAEAKFNPTDVVTMFAQLVLTIGKARTFDHILPPPFLGVFDREKIAFIPYSAVNDIFYQNDFNWNVTPSNRGTKEFSLIQETIEKTIQNKKLVYYYAEEAALLKEFVKNNFEKSGDLFPDMIFRRQIDKTNFSHIYQEWMRVVKPSIAIVDWDAAKKRGIIDGDFYLADLLSEDNCTIKDKLSVVLEKNKYEFDRRVDELGLFFSTSVFFKDNGAAHKEFWERYLRPPKEEYWDYIVERRDLLVPQDVRERKGAFFTPPQWVAKAHEYLAKAFGENWQEEYVVWDNSAGTGNLLAGLLNKDNIYASTLDQQDVQVMLDRIENGANLWSENVFQFDFLNDDIKPQREGGKIPNTLFAILTDPEKRKRLIFLINPPYGESGNARTRASKGNEKEVTHKAGVTESRVKDAYKATLGKSLNEKYIQFFARIYKEIPGCKMGAFVHPKYICGGSMKNFRLLWRAAYLDGFATPATTHDNCTGHYPICFFIWDLARKHDFPKKVPCDIYEMRGEKEVFAGVKIFHSSEEKTINDWLKRYSLSKEEIKNGEHIGVARCDAPDFQRNSYCWIAQEFSTVHSHMFHINEKNLIPFAVYFAVRHCIEHHWINDRDQYFFPRPEWETDEEFHRDSLAFTLLHGQNKIKRAEGINHWIPYTEGEAGCTTRFESRFMSDFLKGRVFSPEARALLDAGKTLWQYYHRQIKAGKADNVNASFYDIREHFQGSTGGKMKPRSSDGEYNNLIAALRERLNALAKKIEKNVYAYGFLKP